MRARKDRKAQIDGRGIECVDAVLQIEAAAGQHWITGARHAGVLLNPVLKWLLPLLDGSPDRVSLTEKLADAITRGEISSGSTAATTIEDAPEQLAQRLLEQLLNYLERNAILVAQIRR